MTCKFCGSEYNILSNICENCFYEMHDYPDVFEVRMLGLGVRVVRQDPRQVMTTVGSACLTRRDPYKLAEEP